MDDLTSRKPVIKVPEIQADGGRKKTQEAGMSTETEQGHEEDDERYDGLVNSSSMQRDISLSETVSIPINPAATTNNEGVIPPINAEIEEGLKTPNGSETVEIDEELISLGKFGDTSKILSIACPGVTPINDPLREATPTDSDVINGINSHSVGPDIEVINGINAQSIGPNKGVINGPNSQSIGPDIATSEFNAQFKDNDGEFSIEKISTTTMKGNESDQFNQPPHRAIWKPPPWPILKVNSDDAIFREQNFVGVGVVGVVIQDIKDQGVAFMDKKITLFSVTVWKIWTLRNQVRTNQPCCSPNQLANIAKELLTEFHAVQQPSLPQSTSIRVHWRAPILDMVKVNLDVTLFNREQNSWIGVVMARCFSKLHYSHVKREGNIIAHVLACFVLNVLDYSVWMEDVPP